MAFSDHPRTRRQQKIVNDWENNNRKGTLQACTGFGKTRCAILAMKRAQEIFDETDLLVIVPTVYLKEQWNARLEKWDVDATVKVVNTAVKSHWDVDLLVLDEIHRYASPIFGQIFGRVDYDGILGLTATLPGDEKYDHVRNHCPVFETVGLSEAQREGWVSDFLVYNVPIELDPRERKKYRKMNNKYHSHFSVFDHDFNVAMKCLNSDKAARDYANKTQMDYQDVKKHAVQFIRNVQNRKQFLYNLDSKIDAAEYLLEKTDRKALVFSQSQEAANRVATRAPTEAKAYHSDMTEKEKSRAMQAFKDEQDPIRCLCTARSLDQGADLPEVTLGIVVAGSSKPLQSIQRMGRTLRKEGKRAIVVELYATNTQDERWLSKRQRKTPGRNIRRVGSVDDIFATQEKSQVSIAV
jgi:RNA polymerase primary sigma factor